MPDESKPAVPRLYFLNERHQLAPTTEDGGSQPKPVVKEWHSHGKHLQSNIASFRQARKASPDPTAHRRLYILAEGPKSLEKISDSKKAEGGKLENKINLAGKQSQEISRLGFDLLATTSEGKAIVHATDERIEQMAQSLARLEELRTRDKNRWAHIETLSEIPKEYKTSLKWWGSPSMGTLLRATIDLQPFLTRAEVEMVIKAIRSRLQDGEKLNRAGMEFSGRSWFSGVLLAKTVVDLAAKFQAIFSVHPPLVAIAAAPPKRPSAKTSSPRSSRQTPQFDFHALPCVAVLDTGVPSEHLLLAPYRRPGYARPDGTSGEVQDAHGSLVASRIVFGDFEHNPDMSKDALIGDCSFFDVRVGNGQSEGGDSHIDPEAINQAVGIVTGTAPDIRVFNLSIDSKWPLESFEGSHRDAWLRRLEDLDNRAFSEDILFVVAAGNSRAGLVPEPPYPHHFDLPQWRLGAWSRCFNALTCGGASHQNPSDAVAKEDGAPCPFTRAGPGFARSPKPDIAASAGNCGPDYNYQAGTGMGVWCCNDSGLWEDHAGTSFAAPLVSREAARTFTFLQRKCDTGARPFAALVKAVLALHAKRPIDLSRAVEKLAEKTLGYGEVKFEDIESPNSRRAVFLWQGIIGDEGEILNVELPLPGTWVQSAAKPVLRLIVSWDTPVHHAAEHVWACRKVLPTMRPAGNMDALQFKIRTPSGYPLVEKRFELHGDDVRRNLQNRDNCLLELKYTTQEMAPYPGLLEFSPQQRVAIAYELFDESEKPVSPHPHIQHLPIAIDGTLNRLSTLVPSARQAVSMKVPL